MATPATAPPSLAPPTLPPGWGAEWSAEYKTWFYVNHATQAVQWEFPAPPQLQQPVPPSPPQIIPQQPPQDGVISPVPQPYPAEPQRQDSTTPQMPPPADTDRGLGKSMLGVAGGLLAGAFVAHEVEEHKQHQHNHFGFLSNHKLPLAAGGGMLAGLASHKIFGGNSNAPPPAAAAPPSQHHSGIGSYFANANAPRLYIHCAAYADQDVTHIVRRMVSPGQTLEVNSDSCGLIAHFGDPWPGNRKQFSVLYSYGERPWELAASSDDRGPFALIPHQPLDKGRMEFVKQGRVIAVVWGTGNGLEGGKGPVEKLKEIETTGEFQATNGWMGFDGMCGPAKTAIAYYRTANGGVAIATAREGGTCRLPWNPLAKWT